MGAEKQIDFTKGLADNRDPATLRPGELQKAVGCEYRIGSQHLYQMKGRTSTNTALGAAVQGLHKLQYESGTDVIAAVAGGSIYESAAVAAVSFGAAKVTGLDATETPYFATANDSWIMCNGVDDNYIREAGDVPGGSEGAWRKLGMDAPSFQPAVTYPSLGTQQAPDTNTSAFTNPANAYDGDDDTYAYTTVTSAGPTATETFTWSTNLSPTTARVLYIEHEGKASDTSITRAEFSQDEVIDAVKSRVVATVKVEVSEDIDAGTPTWTTVSELAVPYSRTTTQVEITDGIDFSTKLGVKVTVTATIVTGEAWAQGLVYEINAIEGGALTASTTENTLVYFFTEKYTDSDSVVHESAASPMVEVPPMTDPGKYGVTLSLPGAPVNSFANKYVIYRSLDTSSGGYPDLFQIAEVDTDVTTYTDLLEGDLTSLALNPKIGDPYEVLTVIYGDGSALQIPINMPPPKAKMATSFQGSMVYVPVNSSRLYYSVPATISPVGVEQVPELYFLEFTTGTNDTISTAVRSSNGRVLVVYFEQYSMLVLALPQATDSGLFDQRITEYVSNRRGCVGEHAATEITLPNGRTLAVAVDGLGVWATDGISQIVDWSNDLDWDTHMAGVTLEDIQLVDNPEMRRVELLYEDGNGDRQEFHFFYGRMKQDISSGQEVPLISGPHPMGVQCKFYATLNNDWTGWSGDASATGDVFLERDGFADEANGYAARTNAIPFQVKSANLYMAGLSRAVLTQFGYPLFSSSPSVNVTLIGTFTRDGAAAAQTKTKMFTTGSDKKVYWHAYADKHAVEIQFIEPVEMPALVAYTVEIADAGIGRDL